MAGVLVCGIPGFCPPFARQAIRDGRKGIEIIEAAALRDHMPYMRKAKDE